MLQCSSASSVGKNSNENLSYKDILRARNKHINILHVFHIYNPSPGNRMMHETMPMLEKLTIYWTEKGCVGQKVFEGE